MKILSLIIATFICVNIKSQTIIECHNKLNLTDSLLIAKDTVKALTNYKTIEEICDAQISSGRHYKMAKIYSSLNKRNEAIKQIQKAIEKGHALSYPNTFDFLTFSNELLEKMPDSIHSELVMQTINQFNNMSAEEKNLYKKLSRIQQFDSSLRQQREYYSEARKHNFRIKTKLAISDTIENHKHLMQRAKEFRTKDSTNLQKFVDIIFENGSVPNPSKSYFNCDVLICHLSAYNFNKNIDSLLVHSVKIGMLSPKTYGWYIGYRNEYFGTDPTYFYTHSYKQIEDLNLSEKKTNYINKLRKEIGMPLLPESIWTIGPY